MELGKKSQKVCKKLRKIKPEPPEKKIKTDTPCKRVDARCLVLKKKINCDKNKLNQIEKKNIDKNKNFNNLDHIKKEKVNIKKLNKNYSSLTESKKEETCDDKMTKVAAPVVKMVEPLFELIDFEEEIKVEKISKEECKTPEVELKNYSDEEIKIEKNIIRKISRKKKLLVKDILNIVASETYSYSNSNDSHSSENSNKSSKSDACILPRRNPSRRISLRDEVATKLISEKVNVKKEVKKSFPTNRNTRKVRGRKTQKSLNSLTNESSLNLEKDISKIEKSTSITLSHVPTENQENEVSTSEESINNDKPIEIPKPTTLLTDNSSESGVSNKNNEPVIQEILQGKASEKCENESNKTCNIQQVNDLEPLICTEKENSINMSQEISSNIPMPLLPEEQNNVVQEAESKSPMHETQNHIHEENLEKDINISTSSIEKIPDKQLEEYTVKDCNIADTKSDIKNTNITDIKIESKTMDGLNETNSDSEEIENKHEISKTDISISETSIETKIELTTNIKIENEIDIQKTDLDETMNEKEILSDEKSFTENKIEINSNEDVKEKKISEEKVFSSDESKTNGFDNSKQRFFIFGDEIEEECSSCKIGMETKEISKVNEQICGEIIHKTQEDFSINCYMCWDENNWTFKKFNDLKLFSTHLNTEHTNDEISFQNKRGNSYSLDFVNENSCVMPQSMWFGIYNEMIMFKCGFAKIDTNGYILYSCLECQHAFKNFNTFTKHILGRETKEQKIGEHEENMSPIVSDNMSVSSTNKSDIKDCEKEKSYVKNPALIESCKEFAKEIECNNIDNENNKETSQFKEKNEDNADNNQNSMQEPHIFLPKPKSILESILESAKVNKENSDQEDKSPTLLLESIDPNVNIPTEKKIEENLPDLVSHAEINKKSSNEEHVPDTYNYKQITTALFDIFKEGEEEPASSKLNKILSVGESYRSIKEKEKMDLEEREKQKILSLSIQKDTRPRIEGANIVTKHILDLNDKLALLTCKYCSRRYTCLTNLREHFRIHVGDRMVICYKCKRGFSKKSNLEEHINIFHLDSSDKNIDLDVLGDNRKEIAKNTNITVNENNPKEKGFKCKYCIRFLSNRTVLEDHLRLHFGEKPLKCEKCDLQFLKKSIFDNHVMEVHELRENDGPLENFEGSCNKENNKAFSNKAKNKFKCKQCPETFPTKVGLIEHLIMNHNDGEFKCRFCDLRFSSKKKRSYHEKLHKDGAKFQCNFCDQCFSNLFSLETHESSHKINADFKCRFCDHYFASDKTRILHEEMHETTGKSNNNMQIQTVDIATILQMNNEQAPINSNGNANDSNGTSSDATDRSSNQNTASKNLMVKKIIKKIKRGKRDPNSPLDCRYCKKHFESPHQLSYHERLHEIGKKFQCNICDKILATSYALELHLTAHLRKKNFPKNNFNLKYNGSNMLTNQLTMPMKVDFKPKIEIVSDVTLAPTETMEILNNFFKRDLPEITVTTTSDDESFQKIGVNDIEKNLAAHVLRDTDPYYQLMADFSYQYQMYQMQSALKMENMNFAEISPNNITSGDSEIFDRPKKSRKKKLTIEKVESTIETSKTNLSSPNDQNDLYIENKNIELENPPQELLQNKMQLTQQDNLNTSKDPIKKKDKKKLIPDNNKSLTNVFIKCEYCNKKLNSSDKKLLSRHRRLHIAGDTHKCSFCNKCFATLYYLDKHLRVHHLNKVIQYQCPSCDSVYVLKEALRRHEQRAHKENNSNPKIESKEKEINKIDDNINKTSDIDSSCLESNINDIGDNQFKDQEFAIPEIPKKTNKRSRSKELKLFDCDFCEKAFPTFSSLQTHIDKTHKKHVENFEENYSFKCSYENCKKKFDCQTNLDKHYRLHESGFKCSICNKKTISQISLDNHMKSHGMPISFGCKFCKSKFTMQLTKDIHERKNHNKEHNLSYTQITEALTSASSGLTAIQPVEVIESPNDDDQQMTTELTPLTTLTSLSSLTPLTPLQPTAVFHHSSNDTSVLQSQQQSQLQVTNSAMELTSLEPSTISEATKLSLTLLEPSALCELTAFTEPSVVPMHTANLTDLTSPYDQSTSILHHDHTILGDLASSSTTSTFEAQLITTQCNNSSATLNTSSASSDYAVTNMDTSQITQQSKKPRISDSNMHLESFTMLDDNSSQTEHNSQSELTNFSTFDSTTAFLSTKTDQNMMFTDLNMSTKSIMSDSASLEPLTYSDSMPLSEATTILELTSSSQPTSSSEATAFSESNNNATLIQSSSGKKKRNSGGKSRGQRPTDSEILNLEGDFDMCCENKNFKCTLCQRVYDSWTKFRKHNECHALRPHQCPICPCNFKTDEELFEHKAAHERSEKNFSCEICNRVFISKSRLKAHMLTVHNEEREYKCEYCPSAFKTKSRLVDHTRCHTGEKPIKCHYCDEHFSRAAYRLKHERALHLELLEIDLKNKEGKKEKKN
ncbi:zinc finger protein 236-like isoform X2 [Condylostylus longicornis]|uniref:zinc finger protein 236-like isoform X2 n=1 Tax=Condylostylus longicornis TaxID=2530218 RepID=UPI00244E052B|nr:zinc finger protein 236-like isoform X2 [Condylostylus longicornis]